MKAAYGSNWQKALQPIARAQQHANTVVVAIAVVIVVAQAVVARRATLAASHTVRARVQNNVRNNIVHPSLCQP